MENRFLEEFATNFFISQEHEPFPEFVRAFLEAIRGVQYLEAELP